MTIEEETPVGYGGWNDSAVIETNGDSTFNAIPDDFDESLEKFILQLTPLFEESTEMSLFMERMIRRDDSKYGLGYNI
jgi:hypothetical protein